MRKRTAIAAGVLLAALPLTMYAADLRFGEDVSVVGQQIVDDVYAAGSRVLVSAPVTGDVYAAGGEVTIESAVSADIAAAGGEVRILGSAGDDVRAAGGKVSLSGSVAGDVLVAGGEVTVGGAGVGGDVMASGGKIVLEAPVMGDVQMSGGEVYINAPVRGTVRVESGSLRLGSKAEITGALVHRGPRAATLEEGATVAGGITYEEAREGGALAGIIALGSIAKLLMLLAGAFFFVLLFRKYVEALVEGAYARPLLEVGRGLAVFIALPFISILLLVTVVGIPLGILALVALVGLAIFAALMAPVVLGSILYATLMHTERAANWQSVLTGVAVFYLVGFIPLLGFLVQLAFVLLAAGSALRLKWDILKEWR